MTNISPQLNHAQVRRTSHLLRPLGWLNERLTRPLATNTNLVAALFELDRFRMHLVATAVAHISEDPSPDLVDLLLHGPSRAVIEQTLGHCPAGLARVLHRMPNSVLPSKAYQQLIELLDDRNTAKFLHHRQSIDGPIIASLSALPLSLRRPPFFKLLGQIDGMDRFVEGLRILSGRAGLTLDFVIGKIGALNQPDQIIAQIAELVESLPLPNCLPPPVIGPFRRTDSIAEIRKIAKAWHNCLAEYLHAIDNGTCAIYLSIHDDVPAAAFVSRMYRLGWILDQIKGPNNIDLAPTQLGPLQNSFAEAGISMLVDVACLRDIVLKTRWSRCQAED